MTPLIAALVMQAQNPTLPADGVRFSTKVTLPVSIGYLVHLPEGYDADKSKKWPVVFFLHGAGERGADLEMNRNHGPFKELAQGRKIPAVVIAPQCPTGDWWASDKMLEVLKGLFDDVETRYRVDKDRELLTGLSMGGFGTWALGERYPKRFAALAPICGAAIVPSTEVAKVAVLKDVPIWTVHGAADPVVPVQGTRDRVAVLRAAGSKVRYDELPGVEHDSWTATYSQDAFWNWLLAQKR